MTKEDYGAIVVGSGLAGLTAGATLAGGGVEVLVIEQAQAVGGYAHSFRRGPYVFDPAIHLIPEVREGEVVHAILDHLGVSGRCEFLPTGAMYDARFPGLRLRVATDPREYEEALAAAFPQEAMQIRAFLALCASVHLEAHELPPHVSFDRLDEIAGRFPLLMKYRLATTRQVLDEHFSDERLKALLGSLWLYMAVPPSQMAFLTYSQYLSVAAEGLYFCRGGFQTLVDALTYSFTASGGELLLEARVTKIHVSDKGGVTGVGLDDGRTFRSPIVISSFGRRTFAELIGYDQLPRGFVRRLTALEPSLSAFSVFASGRFDAEAFGLAHDTFIFRSLDHEQAFAHIQSGTPGAVMMCVPTQVDPSLAPPGEHVVVMTAPAKYEGSWAGREDAYLEQLLSLLDSSLPGLRPSLTIHNVATPETFERFTLNEGGAMYGWAVIPRQIGSKVPRMVTPVDGLYLTGHWTEPGHGALRVLVSGYHAAQLIGRELGLTVPSLPLAIDSAWLDEARRAAASRQS